ncbi:MAG: glycosyltransferase [Chitinispirillia bacterium]|nr:glycosyltransferase [Chitinispirillia bacterium]
MPVTISVIIPIYNAEKYLEKCLDSVLSQTFSDFECILIDDGSRDSSPAICDEYAKKDERIKVIHQKNSGASAARNTGLDIALGEWITFVDSDDWVNENYIGLMYNNAVSNKCGLSICGMQSYGEDGGFIDKSKILPIVLMDQFSAKKAMFADKYFNPGTFSKLVMRKYIYEYGICFDVGIKVGEDTLFWFEVIDKIDKVVYDSTPCYNYMRNTNSLTFSEYFYINYMDALDACQKMLLLEKNESVKKKITSYKVAAANTVCFFMAARNIDHKEYSHFYFNIIRKNLLPYLLNCDVLIKYKILAILALCPVCYKRVVRIKEYIAKAV